MSVPALPLPPARPGFRLVGYRLAPANLHAPARLIGDYAPIGRAEAR